MPVSRQHHGIIASWRCPLTGFGNPEKGSPAICVRGGGAVSTFSQEEPLLSNPPPEWKQAVQIALSLFARFSVPSGFDAQEWRADCLQEAWLAVIESAPRYRCPDPPPTNPESHYVFWLVGKALKRLRAYRAKEINHHTREVPMVVQDEEGEEVECEFEDEKAREAMEAVLERVEWEQVLARVSQRLDVADWAIMEGLLGGKTQKEVGLALGISQSAVSRRWLRICALVRQLAGDLG